jgi:signal transduction histidine kinase
MLFDDKKLEFSFLKNHAIKSTINYKISIFLGMLTAGLFSFVDLWSLPLTSESAIKLRLIFMTPALLLCALYSFTKNFYKHIDWAIYIAGLSSGLSIAIIIAQSNPIEPAYDSYYAGILLVNVWVTTFIRAKFKPAFFAVVTNIIIYLIVALKFQDYTTSVDPQRMFILYSNLSFFLSISIICLLGCRDMEIYSRNDFLQNEILLRDQAKLVEAIRLAAVGEMAAGVAHEINNPLTIILSSLQKLDRKIKSDSLNNDYLNSTLEKMNISGNRIAKIIKSLKIFSRDGSNDDFQNESLVNIINDSIYFCHEKFTHSDVELIIDQIPDVKIMCRLSQISQVLVNLLNNAYDAVENLENAKVQISFNLNKTFLLVSVIDNGAGVPLEIREKIMSPFFTTKPVGKGTGLGLSLSNEIIEQHGGKFTLENVVNGTIFTFTIPLKS